MRPSYSLRSFYPCEFAGRVTWQAFLKKETDWKRSVVLPFQFCHNLIFPGPLQLHLKWMDNPSLLQRWLGENFSSQTHPVLKPRTPLSLLAPESMRLNPVERRGHPLRRPPQSQAVHAVHVQLQLSGALTLKTRKGQWWRGRRQTQASSRCPTASQGATGCPQLGLGADERVSVS